MIDLIKFSEIKKNPSALLGQKDHAAIVRYSDVVAFVVSPTRMRELLDKETQANQYLSELEMIASGGLHPSDLINL